jgi:hypothetical protein
MMQNQNLKPALGLLILVLTALACNLPLAGGASPGPNLPTLTPYPTSEFTTSEFEPDPVFFVEEFDQNLPEGWIASPGWSVGSGKLSVNRADAELEIPGDWQDLSLFTHLQFNSEGFALQFNRSETGAYQIDLTREGLTLSWLPTEGELELLSQVPLSIDQDWHDLVLRSAHGQVDVVFDQQSVLEYYDLGLSPTGSIKLINSGAGTLEIERIVVGPPGS